MYNFLSKWIFNCFSIFGTHKKPRNNSVIRRIILVARSKNSRMYSDWRCSKFSSTRPEISKKRIAYNVLSRGHTWIHQNVVITNFSWWISTSLLKLYVWWIGAVCFFQFIQYFFERNWLGSAPWLHQEYSSNQNLAIIQHFNSSESPS